MMQIMIKALAEQGQPQASFFALAKLISCTLPVKLFTLMKIDHQRQIATRCYSTLPAIYPCSGEKPLVRNGWFTQVIEQQNIFVANSIEEISQALSDYQLIASIGCESCLNIPLVVNESVVGTLNFLDQKGFFTPEKIAVAHNLKPAGVLALLVAEYAHFQGVNR